MLGKMQTKYNMEMHYFRFVSAYTVFRYQKKIHAHELRNDLVHSSS